MTSESLLLALSPLDGRYYHECLALAEIASEYGLIRCRLIVEIQWLQALANEPNITEIPALSSSASAYLQSLIDSFDEQTADRVKSIEKNIKHDVKAVEYLLKEAMLSHPELQSLTEFVHFACTSEDINNLAYALMLVFMREKVFLPQLNELVTRLTQLAHLHAAVPMLARTHGQPASPTTVGKEIANVVYRLQRLIQQFESIAILGKINGAVGNFNAHQIAYPEVDWPSLAQHFVETLGLTWNPLTTQIEPHDYLAEYFQCLTRINTVLIGFCQDMWGYISLNYFVQIPIAGEVGSSTMPHKVNPIHFENAEGNFGIANALFTHFAQKLPISRWQRDLTDSTVLRNIGVACGHMLLALKSLQRGLSIIRLNETALARDLEENWEVLGEAFQTIMRRYQIAEPYEKLKALTRGKMVTAETLSHFVDTLTIPDAVKIKLKLLTPATYTGLAETLVRHVLKE